MSLHISLVQQCTQQKQETFEVSFSPDGNYLWSTDWTAIYQWKRGADDAWDYCQCIPVPGYAASLQCTPDGKMFVYRGRGGTVHFCSLEGKELTTLSYPNQVGVNFVFSSDQRWFMSGDSTRNVVLWDLLNHQLSTLPYDFPFHEPKRDYSTYGTQRQELEKRDEIWRRTAERFQITPDGQQLIFIVPSDEGHVHICHVDPLQKRLTLQKTLPFAGMIEQKIAPNGKMLALSLESEVYLYNLESLQPLHTFSATGGEDYGHLAFSPDSQYLMSSRDDGIVDIWSLATCKCSASFAAHPGLMNHWSDPIGGLDWSRTGYIATGGASAFEEDMEKKDYTIKLWKVEQ